MRRRIKFEEESTTVKSITIFILIGLLFFSTSIALTSYPQHLAISNRTIIQEIRFIDEKTVLIRGNQVQVGTGDVIPLEKRDYIRITGNQVQIGKINYPEAIRIITSEWYQQILFSQNIGKFESSQTAQVIIDETSFVLTPLSQDITSVTVTDTSNPKKQSHYNIVFKKGTVYINENGIMLKFTKTRDIVTVNTVGFDKHTRIFIRVL